MILAGGQLYETEDQNTILDGLADRLNDTLQNNRLDPEVVISAFDAMAQRLKNGELTYLYDAIDYDGKEEYVDLALRMMSREYLQYKMATELQGQELYKEYVHGNLATIRVPLGVIFHIAAGNMDVLPIASIAEGLLTGNINILKLPKVDSGLTITVMKLLVDAEPRLKDYIYVFDTPSTDVLAMKKLADISDGIAVWGGDEAVKAVRSLAKPGTRLIEWGHKLGFAYISGYEKQKEELRELAEHIMKTKQLLCSSCQVIYLDTEDLNELKCFARSFTRYLNAAAIKYPVGEIGAVAELSLRRYTQDIEGVLGGEKKKNCFVVKGVNVSVTAQKDMELELSYMYGNVLVKALPEDKLSDVLRGSKEYLQTAGLICSPDKRRRIADKLLRCGLERVTRAGNMSEYFDGEAHDGEYPLQRYTRLTNIEI